MSAVMHGRRRGQTRTTPEPVEMPQVRSAKAPGTLPSGTDLRQVTVLTKGDWDRIQFQLNRRSIEEDRQRQTREARQREHELSKERVKNWSNTVIGQRQKKLEARRLREDKDEEERKLIDIEEAKYQAGKRKDAIEKAKTQQYYQTDRVKGFHGALLLTEVLKEREAQLELRMLKERAGAGQDNIWLDKANKDYEEGILRDQEEARKRIKSTKENASFQKAQIRQHLKAEDAVVEDEQIEGEELKRLAAQYQMEKKRLDDIRNGEARQLMSDNLKQIQDVHRMKEIGQQQEEEEDEECRIFAAAKRKMLKLRAEKEKQLHEEKQGKLEKIRDKLRGQMQQKLDDEDDRIRKAETENEAKRAKEEAEKEAKMRTVHGDIAKHRHDAMRQKEEEARAERKREMEMLAVRKEADTIFANNEEDKRTRKFGEKKDVQKFHIGQMDLRKDNENADQQQQLEQDKRNSELHYLEEQQFQEYARKVIDHCEKGGRNTYPLRKAAKEGGGGGVGPVFSGKGGVRPSYMVADQSGVQMPTYQGDSTDEIKKDIYGDGRTGNRLGFVW